MDVHSSQAALRGGAPLEGANAALILIHGRGSSAGDILGLGEEVSDGVAGVALLAPEAAGHTWYPQRFLAPVAQNEPFLGSALGVIARLAAEAAGACLGPEKLVIIGFSQGACLALEFAARNPCRYGGVVGLSGALIGEPGAARQASGGFGGTPVYLGCSDRDAHIPLQSVEDAAAFFSAHGAGVTKSIFRGMGHAVNPEELSAVRAIVRGVAAGR
ncbi:MAG TPA: dienelactone hydrolase family protein [Opitutaceae bacterium]|jgi:predicted esterase